VLIRETGLDTNGRVDIIVKIDDKISPALFDHICLSIWIALVKEIAAEIFRIKISFFWENLNK
jgi:hypothetical protein